MAKVTQNRSGSEALRQAMQAIAHKQARAGFFEYAKYPDGTPVAYVAAIQEFHPEHARPFMRPTIEAQRNAWRESLRKGCNAVLNGQLDARAMLEQFGARAASDIKKTISQITAPPLAKSTLAARQSRKKTPGVSAKPLVDTGLLIASVNNDVVDT
jgi:hypothetical protein